MKPFINHLLCIRHILFFLTLILLTGCYKENDDEKITFSFNRDNFKETKSLKAFQKTDIEEALNPLYMYVVKDSLVLVSNRDATQPFKAGLYSLNSGKLIREIAPKGNGPEEFIDCTIDVRAGSSDIFYLEDAIQNTYRICSIDSILSFSDYILRSFTYSRDVIRLCPVKDKYIGYNFWYLNEKAYDNKVMPLETYPMTNEPKARTGTGHEYFVANVTGGYVFMSPDQKKIWVANLFDDKIEIYNDSLRLTKCLHGPDHFERKYKLVEEDNFKYLFFEKGTSFRSYLAYTLTKDHVYLVYEGTNGTPYHMNDLKNVEIFKLDWNGNLICNYRLDKYAYAISVDSKEEYLYAACYQSYDGEVEFVKYKLN